MRFRGVIFAQMEKKFCHFGALTFGCFHDTIMKNSIHSHERHT